MTDSLGDSLARSSYLPHVDGLRAVAVLSVLFFHLGWETFRGGFAGVDVFFVISGYLITRLLKEELDRRDTLSLTQFYVRRIRRLLPALLVMLCLTSVASALLVSPSLLHPFGSSLVAAVVGLSNFVFWGEADYFDVAAHLKPLLHTWSLGIEEQFYFFWPGLMLAATWLGVRKGLPWILVLLAVLSLSLNYCYANGRTGVLASLIPAYATRLEDAEATMFYLVPFRIYEFALGALLLWIPEDRLKGWANNVVFVLGIFLLALSFVLLDDTFLFPSGWALLPCAGTAMLIYTGGSAWGSVALRQRPVLVLGRMSYSVYLYHWPVLVFWKYVAVRPLALWEQLFVIVVSIGLGWLSWRYIEQPFRKTELTSRPNPRRLGVVVPVLALVLVGTSVQHDGWAWRVNTPDAMAGIRDSLDYHRTEYGGAGYPTDGLLGNSDLEAEILLVGDSHGLHYAEGLYTEFALPRGRNIEIRAGLSCFHLPSITRATPGKWDVDCPEAVANLLERAGRDNPNRIVVVSHAWRFQLEHAARLDSRGDAVRGSLTMDDVVEGLLSLKRSLGDTRLVVIGEVPGSPVDNIFDLLTRPDILWSKNVEHLQAAPLTQEVREINARLQEAADLTGAFTFLNPATALCPDQLCRVLAKDHTPYYSDQAHLSKAGSRFVIRWLLDSNTEAFVGS